LSGRAESGIGGMEGSDNHAYQKLQAPLSRKFIDAVQKCSLDSVTVRNHRVAHAFAIIVP
jgi:hypothetical protein